MIAVNQGNLAGMDRLLKCNAKLFIKNRVRCVCFICLARYCRITMMMNGNACDVVDSSDKRCCRWPVIAPHVIVGTM